MYIFSQIKRNVSKMPKKFFISTGDKIMIGSPIIVHIETYVNDASIFTFVREAKLTSEQSSVNLISDYCRPQAMVDMVADY